MAGHVIGVSNFTLFKVIKDDETGLVCGAPRKLQKKTIKVSVKPKTSEGSLSADNQVVDRIRKTTGADFSLNLADLTSDERTYMLGAEDRNGIAVDNVDQEKPYFVVAFEVKKTKGVKRLVKYLKVMFSTPGEDYETEQEGNINFQTPTMEGTVDPVIATVPGLKSGDWRMQMDSDSEVYTLEKAKAWFDEAYSSVDDVAFELLSSTPADKTTGVAADSNVELSFSYVANPSSVQKGVSIIGADGIVPYTMQDSSDERVVLKPDTAFAAGEKYSVVVSQAVLSAGGRTLKEEKAIQFTIA